MQNSGNVVWIGIKGTYALKEWGYERPSLGLFDSVTEIVRTHYKKTGNPISRNKIFIEISEYRKVINRNSLIMAITLNDQIACVSKNHYIPIYQSANTDEFSNPLDEEIHRGIKCFREKKNNL